jgi:hypothetical protein
MPSVSYAECHKLALYADCHYAECYYAKCPCAECRGAIQLSSRHYKDFYYATN